ncbi:MAG TPA: hypothetical protein VK698_17145 [Kofleriaceae bacterium]|nr:hypothetical protein [Kofleriaceae bacterium]
MRTALVLLLTVSQLACHGHEAVKPPAPPAPARPADVIAIASVRSVVDAAAGIRAYADAVRPGAGVFVSVANASQGIASMLGAASADGIAMDRPLHLILLDPRKYPKHPVVLLAHADPARLRLGAEVAVVSKEGVSLVGDRAAVDLCAAWALGPLAAEEAPARPTVRVDPRALLERYRAEIERGMKMATQAIEQQGSGIGPMLMAELDIMLRIARQTREVRLALAADAAEAALELSFTPIPGSAFEQFNRAQRPAQADLLARVASPRSTMIMIGYYAIGPVGDELYALVVPTLARWVGTSADASFRRRWDDALGHFKGPFAAAGGEGSVVAGVMRHVLMVDDGPKTIAAMTALFPWTRPTHVEMGGIGMDMTPRRAVATHEGISIDEAVIHYDWSKLPPAQAAQMRALSRSDPHVAMAGFDHYVAIAMGPQGAVDEMKRLIGVVRRGPAGQLPPGARTAVDAATGRKASFLVFMNLAAMMQAATGKSTSPASPATSGMTMEVGFPDGDALIRFGMPAAHVGDLQRTFAP